MVHVLIDIHCFLSILLQKLNQRRHVHITGDKESSVDADSQLVVWSHYFYHGVLSGVLNSLQQRLLFPNSNSQRLQLRQSLCQTFVMWQKDLSTSESLLNLLCRLFEQWHLILPNLILLASRFPLLWHIVSAKLDRSITASEGSSSEAQNVLEKRFFNDDSCLGSRLIEHSVHIGYASSHVWFLPGHLPDNL